MKKFKKSYLNEFCSYKKTMGTDTIQYKSKWGDFAKGAGFFVSYCKFAISGDNLALI